jgi:RNA polymerase sigma factor (sigma-70 family)
MAGAGGRDSFGDLFQIAATAAWLRERDGEPIRNPRAFLRQVIINQRKMQLRSERRHPATSYDEIVATADGAGGSGIDAIADCRASVSEQVERREFAEIVVHILLTVERRARTVWAMRWLEERTPGEVVAALGISHRQYARLLERANTAMKRKLLAYLAGDWCPGARGDVRAAGRGHGDRRRGPGRARASRRLPELPQRVRDVHAAAPRRRGVM